MGKKNKVLQLGVPPMIGSLVLPVIFNEHFRLHSSVQVRIVEDDNSGLRRLLEDNQIDMAFLPHTQPFESQLGSEPLVVLQNVCFVNKDHPLACRKSIHLKELQNERLVLFKNSFFQTERILAEFSRLSSTPNVLLHTAQVSTVQNMVAANVGVGFMFAFVLKTVQDLVGIPLKPSMTTQVSLAWRENNQITEVAENMAGYMKKYLQEE
jgi:DNA-binding transcriptional LysR family regulator